MTAASQHPRRFFFLNLLLGIYSGFLNNPAACFFKFIHNKHTIYIFFAPLLK